MGKPVRYLPPGQRLFLPGESLLHRCIVQKMLQMRDCTLLADPKRRCLRTAAP